MASQISHLAPIFPVRNMKQSLSFYNALGFKTEFMWEEPPSYVVLSAGENASLHLSLIDPGDESDRKAPEVPQALLYIFVHDVDIQYALCQEKGIPFHIDIGDRDYSMRDFEVVDPDGHKITFGTSLERMV